MDVSSGLVLRRIQYFSGTGVDSIHTSSTLCGSIGAGNTVIKRVSFPARKFRSLSASVFSDDGHLNYYRTFPKCGVKEKEKRVGEISIMKTKKKMKLLKGLTKDLSMFSELGFGVDSCEGLAVDDEGKIISEAADNLLKKLQQIRAEEKELKKKKKQEKKELKSRQMKTMMDSKSSWSSSSESSDEECEKVIQTSSLRKQSMLAQQETSSTQETNITSHPPITENREVACCSSNVMTSASTKRIEVCMGGKCKKSGAAELIDEFERKLGDEGTVVVGCKCMGKCRDGPNVKVIEAEAVDDSIRNPSNRMCVGVGLADVGVILANFFGENKGALAPA